MVSSQFAMKRTSGGLHKRVARMNLDTNMDSGDQRHDETALDSIKNDWHIFRGPPDYTHASLAAIYVNNAQLTANLFELGIRTTSPYQPFHGTTTADINTGLGTTSVIRLSGDAPFKTTYWDYYASLYKYYSVLSCRYRITVENNTGDNIWMHVMSNNQEKPPEDASNEDIQLWRGTQSYFMTPHAKFYSGTRAFQQETAGYNVESDAVVNPQQYNPAGTAVARKNHAVVVHSGQYDAGEFRREVALDSEISTWTATNSNPSYPENLLIRIKADEASSSTTDALNRDRILDVNVRMEVEYLVEFKELDSRVRYPIQRNPITVQFATGNIQ